METRASRHHTSEDVRHSLRVVSSVHSQGDETEVGLRGLLNLGSTCYINCVLQVSLAAAVG